MKKKLIIKSLILTLFVAMQSTIAFADVEGATDLQNFLNGYVAKAGELVVLAGFIEVAFCVSSQSAERRFQALKIVCSGLIMISANDIINAIMK